MTTKCKKVFNWSWRLYQWLMQIQKEGSCYGRGWNMWKKRIVCSEDMSTVYDEVTTAVISFLGVVEVKLTDKRMGTCISDCHNSGCYISSDVDTITKSILCHFTLLDPIVYSRGSLERHCSPAASLTAFVSHACMQVPGVCAAVEIQAVRCRTGGEETKGHMSQSCPLHGVLMIYMTSCMFDRRAKKRQYCLGMSFYGHTRLHVTWRVY